MGPYTPDDLFVGGSCTGCSIGYVGSNASGETLQPGDIVSVVGVDMLEGMATPVMSIAPTTADEPVLGVVAGRTEVYLADPGAVDIEPGVHFGEIGGPVAPGEYLIIVIEGPAQVRAEDAEIVSGDLVYATSTGVTTQADGRAIGMALDRVDAKGLVWVLVGFH